ncbi:MAG: DUF167 domain-containing protein [Armatimonadetes bacterium]|jgi:uncharacterized protein (TIGR00251 family)|nr:DUF167 domain-containing protein [Armatimonadota bacterium]MDI9601498.1 DUF167 domain-containing protein [Acidobacteriota bacterium]NLN89753.1 DUF167 domain-containing protein [candidate division WS1 bacterium]
MPEPELQCDGTDEGSRLAVRVLPRGSRDELVGVRDGRLCVRTTAPPVEGAANARVVAFVAKTLGFRRSSVRVDSGERSREKMLAIAGVGPEEVIAAVRAALGR